MINLISYQVITYITHGRKIQININIVSLYLCTNHLSFPPIPNNAHKRKL